MARVLCNPGSKLTSENTAASLSSFDLPRLTEEMLSLSFQEMPEEK